MEKYSTTIANLIKYHLEFPRLFLLKKALRVARWINASEAASRETVACVFPAQIKSKCVILIKRP